jgi:DNA primase
MPDTFPIHQDADDQTLLVNVIDYYQRTLKEATEGLDYLRSRGITVGEAIDRFRIGYVNRTLGLKLPSVQVKAGREIRTRLQQLGILRSSGHEHYRGCVVFPITKADGSGHIVDIYGRKTGDHLRKGTPLHMHLSDERRGVWNAEALRSGDEIILCPSLFDALTFWNAGYRNVTCTFGPEALTEDHLAAFQRFGVRRVLASAEAVAPRLIAAGIECYLLALPIGLDVNQYALQAADPAQALGEAIRKAVWQGKGASPTVPVVNAPPAVPEATDDADDEDDDGDLDDLSDDDWDDLEDDEDDMLDDGPETIDEPASDSPLSATPAPVLTASPLPPAPQDVEAGVRGDEVTMQLGLRRYRIRGLSKNLAFDQMKVNVLATTEKGMFVDTFDLYVARHRRQFIAQAAVELNVEEQTVKKDLGWVLLKLEELQDQQISQTMAPKELAPNMTPEEREAALRLLRDPNLLDRIVADFDVVGETTNKLVGYLAAVSRKLDQPLAIIIQSSSAAGKTSLMEAVLAFVPPEDQVKYSAMTGQSLFYMGETDLQHKILAIVEEEGAQRASYALKLLQSEGALTIASTGKDSSTGRMVTQEYRVEGPVMIFLTTTAIKIDEELLNRCIVLSVDENREQTRAIHCFQRRRQTLVGLLADQDRKETLALHCNAQRLLRPLLVANPFAESLTFLDDKTRTRRDHLKYLTLIRAVALLHQYQRPVKTTLHHDRLVEYIEVTLDDIAVANRLACEVLGRSVDELPPQTRRLLNLVDDMVTADCKRQAMDRADYRFSRRDIREFTGWGHTQLKVHLKRLEELEYLLIHRGGRGQSFVYELLYEPSPDAGSRFLARLIDVEQLRRQYDGNLSGPNGEKSGRGRGQVGVKSGQSRPLEIDASADAPIGTPASDGKVSRNANVDMENFVTS